VGVGLGAIGLLVGEGPLLGVGVGVGVLAVIGVSARVGVGVGVGCPGARVGVGVAEGPLVGVGVGVGVAMVAQLSTSSSASTLGRLGVGGLKIIRFASKLRIKNPTIREKFHLAIPSF